MIPLVMMATIGLGGLMFTHERDGRKRSALLCVIHAVANFVFKASVAIGATGEVIEKIPGLFRNEYQREIQRFE